MSIGEKGPKPPVLDDLLLDSPDFNPEEVRDQGIDVAQKKEDVRHELVVNMLRSMLERAKELAPEGAPLFLNKSGVICYPKRFADLSKIHGTREEYYNDPVFSDLNDEIKQLLTQYEIESVPAELMAGKS